MKRKIVPNDIYDITLLDDPQISPDGTKVAYTNTRLCEYSQTYISSIVVLNLQTNKDEFVLDTYGSSNNPVWNYDGSKLAFVSNKSGDNQIWIYDENIGYPYQLTTMRNGASDIIWSPTKNHIYFLSSAESNDNELELIRPLSEADKKEKEKLEKESPLHIKEVVHKFDGIGRLTDKKSHIWMVDIDKAIPKKLTNGQYNFRDYSISSDGNKILYVSDPMEDVEFRPQDMLLWTTDLETFETTLLIDAPVLIEKPTYNKDLSKIIFIGHEAELGWGTIHKFYEYDLALNKYECINRDFKISIGNTALSDLRGGGAYRKIYWNYNTDEVYFQTSYKGNNSVYKLKSNHEIELVVGGDRNIYSFSIEKNFDNMVICYTTPTIPNDIGLYKINDNNEIRLTNSNLKFLEEVELSIPEGTIIESFDGTEIQGWIMKPFNFSGEKKYPLILEIHGGPQMMYSNSFMLEFQVLCANGYVVYYSNPRGSSGYTQEFMGGIQRTNGGVGGGDYKDLMMGVDFMETQGYIDTTRMGVTGGSFGGFMTNWIVGHTDRFKAAVTQRSISNWFSFQGVSDYGYCDAERAHQIDFFEELDEVMRISPITYVKNIKTPLLILHSEFDLRCPLEQAQQLFTQLKMLRKETELVIFPNSSHGLSRNGKPNLRIERLNYIVNWFNRYIKE